ncbi:hypothetical protein [Palleronia sp.]|uniref:hypothetical protein n=1 Tax=Palleronia sp. TaxID=1940284 RepID=UPI0035C79A88
MVERGEDGRSWFAGDSKGGAPTRCELSEDGLTVTHGRNDWAESFDISELDRRLAFYRRMLETYRHPSYAQDAAVLAAALEATQTRAAA